MEYKDKLAVLKKIAHISKVFDITIYDVFSIHDVTDEVCEDLLEMGVEIKPRHIFDNFHTADIVHKGIAIGALYRKFEHRRKRRKNWFEKFEKRGK